MGKYIVKRILSLIPVLIIVSLIVFSIMHLTPGDPAVVILGMEATPDEIAKLNEELGLNLPIYEQYLNWTKGVLTGDFGYSIFMKEPVLNSILEHMSPTISLSIFAEIIALLIAIPVGIFSAYNKGTIIDRTLMSASLLGLALPSFLLGLLLMIVFGVSLKILPIAGYKPINQGIIEHLRYLILPAISLGTIQAALISRMIRSSMVDVMNTNYIKTARAKGVKEFCIVMKHSMRNAMMPILTVIGQSFGSLVTGAVVVETVFNIPGIGQLIINSIKRRDFVTIQGVVLFVTLIYILVNLVVDLLYGTADPRVRLEKVKE
ncbi:peptide ABC transporter permease protein [Gottschalkia acidurici 9a]|uniref:Peptide ABC transporter permease protein n=1 Tax=Gottschalkia acidurici (strain ATCC 7906 / DSM 604 / BCRC 14475 / CIP 104303 / KCTC 5404 / NCIMB 10678 / 9a) TaxID=1128398 RepID=K0AZK5_GOTA9|nr:ABC transporter permease [Gottschalkia acidurici]AFS78150.1 peptide ABC transporter permease protein [Gottschalkia acidurici 9a]